MVHARYGEEPASITERVTVVLEIPFTTTMGGGEGTIIHIPAHITGKPVCIFPVTLDTVF